MNTNALLQQFSERQLVGFILVLARVSPLFLLAPIFSSNMVPARARGVLAVALAFGLAPLALHGQRFSFDGMTLAGLIGKELLVGLSYSFALAAVFAAVSVAGSFLDTAIGFSYGSLVDPITGTQSTVLSQLYSMVGLLVFIAIDGDHWMIEGLARTYQLVPIAKFPSINALVGGADKAFVSIFGSAIELAAPVMLAVLITDCAMGLVARVMPQLNVFAVGFPAKIAVGLLVMGVSLPFMGGWIADQVQVSVSSALQSIHVA
ncbi:MAG TPA: flagellar biosynthetic protein FliR [Thermoleophilaceae bacterium]